MSSKGEALVGASLYASAPGTMAWSLANGTRLADSVLDPGYSTQADLRSVYVAYDLTDYILKNSSTVLEVQGTLGFGKYGCKCVCVLGLTE